MTPETVGAVGEMVERVDDRDHVQGIVERGEAVSRGWLHRVATTVCRDEAGRILVYRRPKDVNRFPECYDVMVGGAVRIGESYEAAAAREVTEELGVRSPVCFLFKFLCHGAISPYWLGVHEAVISTEVTVDPTEVAWHGWLTETELQEAVRRWPFIPDGQEAFSRYLTLRGDAGQVENEQGPLPAPTLRDAAYRLGWPRQ
ncbi:NUDIX domain-containing protein [Streptomyces katrae]|uniref:NUDIX domain-containing protein n=1 Tax=Streptomyces katrae TaxID=68223 RepID=UPI000B910A3C